jgi:abequosyltransferase
MEPTFSICIPTYNRADCIGGCLQNIAEELTEEIEIVILDGGSSDNTPGVVAAYQKQFPAIRYFRRGANCGVDEDILKVLDLARGDYCWLMSDDDYLERGSIDYVLARLREYPNLAGASVNYAAFDKTMSYRVKTVPAVSRGQISRDHLFTNREECFGLLGIHFGFLSAQIIRRDLWQEVVRDSDLRPYKGSCWILVYMIGRILERNPNWLYIHRRCVRYRTGNDSFTERLGTLKRQLVTHKSYATVVHGLFGEESKVGRQALETLLADRMPRTLANTKANGASLHLQAQLLRLYTSLYWSFGTYWWKVFPIFMVPNFVCRFVRTIYMYVKSQHSLQPVEQSNSFQPGQSDFGGR